MKIKIIIIITFIFFSINSYSQNFFQLLYGEDNMYENVLDCVETENNEFIFIINEFVDFKTILLKINSTGEIITQKEIKLEDKDYTLGYNFVKNSDTTILLIGKLYDEANPEHYDFWFCNIDYNLDTLWNKIVHIETETELAYFGSLLNSKNEIIISGANRIEGSHDGYDQVYIYKFTKECEYMQSKYYPRINHPSYPQRIIDINVVEFPNSSGYYLNCHNMMSSNIYKIDTLFELDTIYWFNWKPELQGAYEAGTSLRFINNTEFIFAATISNNSKRNIGIARFDTTLTALNEFNYGLENEDEYTSGNRQVFDYIDTTNIFAATQVSLYWHKHVLSCIVSLTKFDSEFNIDWEHYFFTDSASYMVRGVKATADGGALIYGNRTDTLTWDENVFILKTDANGNITHINGKPSSKKTHEVILYPNPGTTELNIRKAVQLKNCMFFLYDSGGKLIIQKKLTQDITTLNTAHLQSGIYLYKVISENKIVETGKWVKE